MNKKGSISISINMIVVVVLAFVMLGLMLTLGQSIVDNASETASQVSEQTRQDIVNKLTRSTEPLYFTQREYEVPFGQRETIAFGMKNTQSSNKYLRLEIFPITADGTESSTPLSPSTDASSNTINDGGSFFWTVSSQVFGAGESKVFDVQYRAPSGNLATGTYIFKFKLFAGDTVDESRSATEPEAEQIIYMNVI